MTDTTVSIAIQGGTLTVDQTTLQAAIAQVLSTASFTPTPVIVPPPPSPSTPGPVSNVVAKAGQGQVVVESFTAPTSGPAPTGFAAYATPPGPSSRVPLYSATPAAIAIPDLPAGTPVTVNVHAFNDAGAGPDTAAPGTYTPTIPTPTTPAAAFLALAAQLKAANKLMAGQSTQYYEGNTNDETQAFSSITPLYAQTGKLPAIIGVTANWFGSSDPVNDSGGGQPSLAVVEQIIADWCSSATNAHKPAPGAGVVQINWGQPSPVDGKTGPAISSANLASLVTPGSALYNTLQASTLKLQNWLLQVTKANPNAVLLLRLFAELNGNWVWYGCQNNQTDVANQITMQQQVHTTLFSGAGAALKSNVLIVYNANNYGGMGPAAAWPGNAYADIAGYDMYSTAWTAAQPPVDPATYTAFAAFGVPLIHSEVAIDTGTGDGPTAAPNYTVDNMLIPNFLRAQEPAVVGYVQWNDNGQAPNASMSITLQNNAKVLMNEPYIVTLSDLATAGI